MELNLYGVIVLAALLGEFALHLASDLLNLRALSPELPAEFRDVYDSEKYRKSQEYTRARTRFGLVTSAVGVAVTLAFWFLGGFGWFDEVVRGLGLGPIVTGLLYIGGLVAGRTLLGMPFSWYSTFVIEERFGFNRTDAKTFWNDRAKGLVLGAVLGAPILALLLYFFESAGSNAWLWAWIAISSIMIVLQFVVPTWIMPLFNKFTPLEDGDLRRAILEYARSVSFPLEGIFVMDGSKRSTKSNAFFTGFGKHKRVALFDTLIERHSQEELLAVVAHEIGHYKRKHILQGLIVGILHTGALLALLGFFIDQPGLFAAFGVELPSVYVGLVLFGLLYTPAEMLLSFLFSALSRRNEYQADEFAAETTGNGEPLVAALKKLSADNLSNLTPHPLHVALNYSHPTVLQRIQALRRTPATASGA